MPTRRRKVEVHQLTISGLERDRDYASYLSDGRGRIRTLADSVWEHGTKSHALHNVQLVHRRLRMLFLSFTTGYRPDILDTQEFAIQPNPLSEHQTGVEWTHVLAGPVGAQFLLLIERSQVGIWPTTIEAYLQWMIDRHPEPQPRGDRRGSQQEETIVVSIEARPAQEFIARLDGLTRVTRATVRTVRPNPGWHDLETELGLEAGESDAHKAEVSMTARRRHSLSRSRGIVAAIRRLFQSRRLNYAAVQGEREGEQDSFTTQRLGEKKTIDFELDEHGQVQHEDAWQKLDDTMNRLE